MLTNLKTSRVEPVDVSRISVACLFQTSASIRLAFKAAIIGSSLGIRKREASARSLVTESKSDSTSAEAAIFAFFFSQIEEVRESNEQVQGAKPQTFFKELEVADSFFQLSDFIEVNIQSFPACQDCVQFSQGG